MFPKTPSSRFRSRTEITIRAVITGPSGVPGLVAVLSPRRLQPWRARRFGKPRAHIGALRGFRDGGPRNPELADRQRQSRSGFESCRGRGHGADRPGSNERGHLRDDLISALGSRPQRKMPPRFETPGTNSRGRIDRGSGDCHPEDSAATAPASIIDTAGPACIGISCLRFGSIRGKEPELPSRLPPRPLLKFWTIPSPKRLKPPEHYFADCPGGRRTGGSKRRPAAAVA